MEWVACVGLDWGGSEHAWTLEERNGERTQGRIKSSSESIHEWARGLREQFPTGTIVVAFEHGCSSLLYALMAYEYLALVPINPRASSTYRESLRLSGSSSDPVDAALICDFVVKHLPALRVWKADEARTRKLRVLAETRRTLVDQRTGLTHTLAATLKEYFPQVLQWFGGESARLQWVVLTHWSTLEELAGATLDQLVDVLRAQRCQKVTARAQQLIGKISSAVPLTRDAATIEAYAMYARALVALLIPLDQQISNYDQAIASSWADHPDRAMFESLPGAGAAMAPRLAVAFGADRERYQHATQMQCYSGIAPVTKQSGKRRSVQARWGYPTFLHQTFHEFAACSLPQSRWAKAFYDERRERGDGHHQAIRALAFRWMRIIFRMWIDSTNYDEETYLAALRRRHSPLALRLAA